MARHNNRRLERIEYLSRHTLVCWRSLRGMVTSRHLGNSRVAMRSCTRSLGWPDLIHNSQGPPCKFHCVMRSWPHPNPNNRIRRQGNQRNGCTSNRQLRHSKRQNLRNPKHRSSRRNQLSCNVRDVVLQSSSCLFRCAFMRKLVVEMINEYVRLWQPPNFRIDMNVGTGNYDSSNGHERLWTSTVQPDLAEDPDTGAPSESTRYSEYRKDNWTFDVIQSRLLARSKTNKTNKHNAPLRWTKIPV